MDRIGAGQLFFREMGWTPSGQRFFMVVGLVSAPEDSAFEGEHQYTAVIAGDAMTVTPEAGKDLTEVARGMGADGLLRSAIWRTR